MPELTDDNYPLIHHKNPSWLTKVTESKTMLVWLILCFVLGGLGGVVGGFVGPLVGGSMGLGFIFPVCFLVGALIGLSVVFSARFVDRSFFGALKAGVTALENRLIEGTSENPREDLEKLVTGSLKLKRIAAADAYSKRLLAISMLPADEKMTVADWVVATDCWASTEKYHQGWNYKLVWLYQTRGVLTVGPEGLDFQSKAFTIQCHPSMITSVEVKRHPLWMKPLPLRFISVTIKEFDCQHTFNFTPSYGQTDTVWDCNRMVATWAKRLDKVRSSV